jgi:alkylation response protein AidB-like acyl-CoA dehydrogenase
LACSASPIPEQDGGAGLDAVAAVIVHHELSKYDPGFCLAYLAHSMLFVNNFYHCASAEQRARYLPRTISGEWVAGMGMTEPGAGTDVLAMTTTATRDGDSFVLNGTKTYITNGCEGYCFLVYAKVDGKHHRVRGRPRLPRLLDLAPHRQAGHARLDHVRADLRGLQGAGGEPAGRGGRAASRT